MSRILVAEDNLPNRELIREILKAWAHEVIEAEDGPQVLDKIAETKPELVLLDIQMSVLDGYAVVRQLGQRTSCPSLKVVAYRFRNAGRSGESSAIRTRRLSHQTHRYAVLGKELQQLLS